MNVQIANYDPAKRGGGWTFLKNFTKGFTHDPQSDIFFIAGPTLATHDEVDEAKRQGKKIVLRIDNAVRNSRNRGTGMTRMKAFCDKADLVIYQSEWAKRFLYPFTKKDGEVILNGVDVKEFGEHRGTPYDDTYLYVRSSRDEGKQWIMAWYWFIENNKVDAKLNIVGKFSHENAEYNFDFYNNEKFVFWGEQKEMQSAYYSSKYFLYTYLNDACSNTLLEARACGMEIVDVFGMLQTGGAPEIMACKDISHSRMIGEYKVALSRL